MSSEPLRARGKARRHADIVAAASDLWRNDGIENVSLNQIAAAAEVAPQTIYNLIGGIDAIGFAVIKAALDRLDATLEKSSERGLELALHSARSSAQIYTEDAKLYRQVLVRIPRMLFEGTHLGRDTADVSIRALIQAQAAGEIVPEIDPARLGRTIYINYLGALYDWACGDSADAEFLRAAEIAVLAPAAACASPHLRQALAMRLFSALSPGIQNAAVGEP